MLNSKEPSIDPCGTPDKIFPKKQWSFLLSISSVNVTKFAVSCGFGHIYWTNP